MYITQKTSSHPQSIFDGGLFFQTSLLSTLTLVLIQGFSVVFIPFSMTHHKETLCYPVRWAWALLVIVSGPGAPPTSIISRWSRLYFNVWWCALLIPMKFTEVYTDLLDFKGTVKSFFDANLPTEGSSVLRVSPPGGLDVLDGGMKFVKILPQVSQGNSVLWDYISIRSNCNDLSINK